MNIFKIKISGLLIASAFAVTACGGGGSSDTTATNSAPVPAVTSVPVAQASQVRKMRGFDVQVTPYVIPGTANNQPAQIQFVVTNPAVIESVTAWSGDDYDTALPVTATQSPGTPTLWSMDWPKQTVPESGLLLSFKLKDGDALETGAADFRFK